MVSKKVLDAAYRSYRGANTNPLPRTAWERQVTGKKPKRKKVGKRPKREVNSWIDIQKEYLAWRKTESFVKWQRRQFLKQGGTCYYCDQPLMGLRQNVEHIIPKSRGGDNRKPNLVLACSGCNKEKNTTILSRSTKQALRTKNKMKRGTYAQWRQNYITEADVAKRLRDILKEEY